MMFKKVLFNDFEQCYDLVSKNSMIFKEVLFNDFHSMLPSSLLKAEP